MEHVGKAIIIAVAIICATFLVVHDYTLLGILLVIIMLVACYGD